MNKTCFHFFVKGPSRRLLWAALCLGLAVFPAIALALEVLTIDGKTFKGKILDENQDFVIVEIENGVQVKIEQKDILSIQGRTKETKPEYPVLGVTYGSPAVLNLVAGYYLKEFGLKLSGGYWPHFEGVQIDLSKKLVDNENILCNVSLVGGIIQTSGTTEGYLNWNGNNDLNGTWMYAGLGAEINWKGLCLEVDWVTGDFPNKSAFPFHVGYVQRFN
jgi:hypothetical protein